MADVRRRIASGQLAAGARMPSTRALASRWGVALATATKALAQLKHEGLVRSVPRVGTVVVGRSPRAAVTRGLRSGFVGSGSEHALSRESIVLAAIAIADAEGTAAISMRSVASALGVPAMSLYRHVPSKDELWLAMIDAAFGEVPVRPRVGGWRAHVESMLRAQWALYRKHAWLARALSVTRPQLIPNGMRHTEALLQAIDGFGLTPSESLRVHLTLMSFVRGVAIGLESELEAEAETGLDQDDWIARHEAAFAEAFSTGEYPMLARIVASPHVDVHLDALFEHGMARMLDGIELYLEAARVRGSGRE